MYVPTIYWDGGYIVQVGSTGISTNINTCKVRPVSNVDIGLTAHWIGNATLNISVEVTNNGPLVYNGYVRVYVTEKVSSFNWKDSYGKLYNFPFLDWAVNKSVMINSGDTYQETLHWVGSQHNDGYGHNFSTIRSDNVMVFAAVFEGTPHLKNSDPYNGTRPFNAYYLDKSIAAEPGPLGIDAYTLAQGGGMVNYTLTAGSQHGSRKYFLLGSVSGTSPGLPLPGGTATLPLIWDILTTITFQMANSPAMVGFTGTLDAQGNATATLNTLGPLPPTAVGVKMYFAYLLYSPFDFTSNPVEFDIVP